MPGDYLADHHVLPVEARGLDPPPVRPFPRYHTYDALSSLGAGWERRQTSHVVTQSVVGVCLCLDLCLCQDHNVKPHAFHRPDGLRQSEALAIPDV